MENTIERIYADAMDALASASDADVVNDLSTQYLGRKGHITHYLRNISSLPAEQRPQAGKRANEIKRTLEGEFKNALTRMAKMSAAATDRIDVSLPGRVPNTGSLHPITQITNRICSIFSQMGFDVVEGPEVESDYYNFEALNIPKNHPARDMQDTFYVSDNVVLRTHTSPTQPRVMEKQQPPVRIIAPGKVYRCDSDLTHTPMFHQVEGLLVDRHVSFADLKGTLTAFIHQMSMTVPACVFGPVFSRLPNPAPKWIYDV